MREACVTGPRAGWKPFREQHGFSLSVLLWGLPGSDSPRVALFVSHCTNLGYFLKHMAEDGHLLAPNFTKSSVQANSPAGPLRDNSKVRERNLIS